MTQIKLSKRVIGYEELKMILAFLYGWACATLSFIYHHGFYALFDPQSAGLSPAEYSTWGVATFMSGIFVFSLYIFHQQYRGI